MKTKEFNRTVARNRGLASRKKEFLLGKASTSTLGKVMKSKWVLLFLVLIVFGVAFFGFRGESKAGEDTDKQLRLQEFNDLTELMKSQGGDPETREAYLHALDDHVRDMGETEPMRVKRNIIRESGLQDAIPLEKKMVRDASWIGERDVYVALSIMWDDKDEQQSILSKSDKIIHTGDALHATKLYPEVQMRILDRTEEVSSSDAVRLLDATAEHRDKGVPQKVLSKIDSIDPDGQQV